MAEAEAALNYLVICVFFRLFFGHCLFCFPKLAILAYSFFFSSLSLCIFSY